MVHSPQPPDFHFRNIPTTRWTIVLACHRLTIRSIPPIFYRMTSTVSKNSPCESSSLPLPSPPASSHLTLAGRAALMLGEVVGVRPGFGARQMLSRLSCGVPEGGLTSHNTHDTPPTDVAIPLSLRPPTNTSANNLCRTVIARR